MLDLLGAEKFAYYRNYERTLPFSYPITALAGQLRYTVAPLSDLQVQQIIDRVAAAFPNLDSAFGGNPYVIPDSAIEVLSGTLTSAQLAALNELQTSQRAGREMMDLNREAATNGLLRLLGQSLKDYPPPRARQPTTHLRRTTTVASSSPMPPASSASSSSSSPRPTP